MCTGHELEVPRAELDRPSSRRQFLATAAGAAAVVGTSGALAAPAAAHDEDHHGHHRRRIPVDHISIQLFTVRQALSADPEGTIASLADIGYQRVETAGFAGLTAAEFKAILDDNGIWASSNHIGIPQPFDEDAWDASLQDALTLESKYIVAPFFGIDFGTGEVVRDSATWRAYAHDLNRAGRQARRAGLKLGYHNHNWEFFRLIDDPSRTAYDVLTEETDRRYVHLEMDLFWVTRGARDPVDLIGRNRGRVRQFHVKDMNQAGSFADLGDGLIDFERIFARSREAGIDEYIVERDDAGSPPRTPADALITAEVGFEYLRSVRF
jgi:sugar phosphate isomerase/epimerase